MDAGGGARAGRAGRTPATIFRRSSPAASSSAWPSPARSPSAPTVLLCDEPTGALDYATGRVVLEALAQHQPRTRHDDRRHHAQRRHRRHGRPRDPHSQRRHRRNRRQCREEVRCGDRLVSALNRMLLRDLWQLRGQAIAAALVVTCGVASFVAMRSTYHSLQDAQAQLLPRVPLRGGLRPRQARAGSAGRASARHSGRSAGADPRGHGGDAGRSGTRRAGHRTPGVDTRSGSRCSTTCICAPAAIRNRALRRGPGERGLRAGEPPRPRRPDRRDRQRPLEGAHDRRHRAVAGVRLRGRWRHHHPGQPQLRRAVDEPRGTGTRIRHAAAPSTTSRSRCPPTPIRAT